MSVHTVANASFQQLWKDWAISVELPGIRQRTNVLLCLFQKAPCLLTQCWPTMALSTLRSPYIDPSASPIPQNPSIGALICLRNPFLDTSINHLLQPFTHPASTITVQTNAPAHNASSTSYTPKPSSKTEPYPKTQHAAYASQTTLHSITTQVRARSTCACHVATKSVTNA